MNWKNVQITCWTVFFIIGCFLWGRHLFAAEIENAEAKKTKKSSIITVTKAAPHAAPFTAQEMIDVTDSIMTALPISRRNIKIPLAAAALDWLHLVVEHRIRYQAWSFFQQQVSPKSWSR